MSIPREWMSGHKEIPSHCTSWGEEDEQVSSEVEENLAESRILEVQWRKGFKKESMLTSKTDH